MGRRDEGEAQTIWKTSTEGGSPQHKTLRILTGNRTPSTRAQSIEERLWLRGCGSESEPYRASRSASPDLRPAPAAGSVLSRLCGQMIPSDMKLHMISSPHKARLCQVVCMAYRYDSQSTAQPCCCHGRLPRSAQLNVMPLAMP